MMFRMMLKSLAFSLCATSAFANELPNSVVVANRAKTLTIYGINEATVAKEEFIKEPSHGRKRGKIKALITLKLVVNGDICNADPNSLALMMDYRETVDQFDLALTASSSYAPNPWGPRQGCAGTEKATEVVVPFEFNWHEDIDSLKTTYFIKAGNSQEFAVVAQIVTASDGGKRVQLTVQ
jgi:hypothetical protein